VTSETWPPCVGVVGCIIFVSFSMTMAVNPMWFINRSFRAKKMMMAYPGLTILWQRIIGVVLTLFGLKLLVDCCHSFLSQ